MLVPLARPRDRGGDPPTVRQPAESGSKGASKDPVRGPGGYLGTPEQAARSHEDLGPIVAFPTPEARAWGIELVWAEAEDYRGRILQIRAGKGISLRLHEEADRTLLLLEGQIVLHIGPGLNSLTKILVSEGEAFRIQPGTLYEIRASTDSRLLEVSAPALDDVVRIREATE